MDRVLLNLRLQRGRFAAEDAGSPVAHTTHHVRQALYRRRFRIGGRGLRRECTRRTGDGLC